MIVEATPRVQEGGTIDRAGRIIGFAALLLVGACSSDAEDSAATTTSTQVSSTSSIPVVALDVTRVGCPLLECGFVPLEPGPYFIDPDLDPTTSLRVIYEVPAEGWQRWIGAAKFAERGHVGLSITTVTNVVRDGCGDHSWADPPVGSSVNDLADALASLTPFQVTSARTEVTMYGYPGVHLEWTVPDLPYEAEGDDGAFIDCVDGELKSWVAAIDTEPGDAFYGYTGPGYTEEFWILDVEGTRLMIASGRSADSPADDIEELGSILDSIRIEP